MDSYESLMEKGQYNLIIKATENAKDVDSLIYRIMAFASLEKFEEALNVIDEHHEKLEEKALKVLIMIHVDILLLMGDTVGAFSLAKYYGDLPYQSQEIEEMIKDIPNRIAEFHKKLRESKVRGTDNKEIKRLLKSQNTEDVITGIDLLKDFDCTPFIKELEDIMVDHPSQSVRSLALLTLVEQQYDCVISFTSHRGLLELNPSQCIPPFGKENFQNIVFEFEKEKDVTLKNMFENTLACIVINNYPDDVDKDDTLTITAIKLICMKSLQQDYDFEEVVEETGLDYFELENKIIELEDIITNF